MATTTTAKNACSARIWLDNASAALTEVSGSSAKITLALKSDIGEFKVFDDAWRYRLECGRDWEFGMDVIYSTTADEAFDLLRDWWFGARGSRSVRIDMPDSSTGSDRYTGEVFIEALEWEMASDEAGPVMVSATFKPTGAITHQQIGS